MNKEKDMTIRLSELLYLLFWGIMLFAKGIGLYDGQPLYKVFLVLAFLCIGVKMCITEYSYREWAVILFLLAWSAVVYRVSGEKGVLICMVTVVAMKNVSVKRCFQTGLIVWAAAMSLRFLTSLIFIGNVETAVQTKNIFGAVLRYFMGYPHPNVLHISYLALAAFVIYCVRETYSWKHLLLLMWGNIFLFFYSYSFTGALIVMIYICLSYYVKKKKISKAEYFLVKMVFPACILVSVILPVALQGKAFELADKIFNNRINFARHFLTIDNMSLLGNNLAAITTEVITMDNAYIFTLVTYGIPVFLLMCAGYMAVVSDYVKQKKNIELAMICCFLAAGFTEPFLFNTSFKNLTLLFIGELLFNRLNRQEAGEKKFVLLKNRDKTVRIPVGKLKEISENLKCVWSVHRRRILCAAIVAAFLTTICIGVFYQTHPGMMMAAKENLLIYERIRIIVTAFSLSFICFIIIGMVVHYRKRPIRSITDEAEVKLQSRNGKIKKFGMVALLILIAGAGFWAVRQHNSHTIKLLIVGDSIGEGAGASDPSLKWYKYLTPYMKDTYGVKLDITNVSMGGNSSYAGYARVMELDDGKEYDLAIICYGENDQQEDFTLYYESILRAVRDKYPSCKLMTILESSQRDYTEKIKIIEALSAHYGAFVADAIAGFRNSGKAYEDLCDDGTHPNDEGQKVYYETVREQMDAYYVQKDTPVAPMPEPFDAEVVNYTDFKYYPSDSFQKTGECACELEINIPFGRLGIDYMTVKGVNQITVYGDGQKLCEKEIGWNNDISMGFIEVLKDECKVDSKIRIEFSSPEQMEAFRGIIVNRHEMQE